MRTYPIIHKIVAISLIFFGIYSYFRSPSFFVIFPIIIGLLFLLNIIKPKPQKLWQVILTSSLFFSVLLFLIFKKSKVEDMRRIEMENKVIMSN
jgi:protein-S-isoprenylcysteine O-methyltransferase Ste14